MEPHTMKTFSLNRWALSFALVPLALGAQTLTERDAIAIDAAVAACLRPSLPQSGVAFEPRIKTDSREWIGTRSAARIAAMGAALRAVPVNHDSIYVCGRAPSSCTLLRGTEVLFAFNDPVVRCDTATV